YKRWGVSFSSNDLMDAYGLARIGEAIMGEVFADYPKVKLNKAQQEVIELLSLQI
ncbi:hypothetical protein LCGC14_2739560, partial [marine sediment metagenome]